MLDVSTKRGLKAAEKKVQAIYLANCSGVQIDIMDTIQVMKVGVASIAAGESEAQTRASLIAFVNSIRTN